MFMYFSLSSFSIRIIKKNHERRFRDSQFPVMKRLLEAVSETRVDIALLTIVIMQAIIGVCHASADYRRFLVRFGRHCHRRLGDNRFISDDSETIARNAQIFSFFYRRRLKEQKRKQIKKLIGGDTSND